MSSASPEYFTSTSSCASSCSALEDTIFRLPSASTQRTPRNFSFERIAARSSAWRSGSRSTCSLFLCCAGITRVVRELAVDELRHQLDRAEAERRLSGRKLDAHFVLAVGEQLRELENRLSRHDDFLARQVSRQLDGGKREAVPVGGDELQAAVFHHHQQPVQVIADVLLRHGVLH